MPPLKWYLDPFLSIVILWHRTDQNWMPPPPPSYVGIKEAFTFGLFVTSHSLLIHALWRQCYLISMNYSFELFGNLGVTSIEPVSAISLKTKNCHNANFVVTMTTYGVTSDDKVGIMTALGFPWYVPLSLWPLLTLTTNLFSSELPAWVAGTRLQARHIYCGCWFGDA